MYFTNIKCVGILLVYMGLSRSFTGKKDFQLNRRRGSEKAERVWVYVYLCIGMQLNIITKLYGYVCVYDGHKIRKKYICGVPSTLFFLREM